MKLRTAIVLVGGQALRMRPYSEDLPKCMVEVSGQPLLYWILGWLKLNDVERVILGVAYKKEVIIGYVQKNDFGVDIVCNDHSEAEDTGDALRLALESQSITDDVFLVMNGDELTDVSLADLLAFHNTHKAVATILACPLRSTFGVLTVDSDHTVTEFEEKPVIANHFMNAGVYLFTQEIRRYLPQRGPLETTTLVELAKEGELKAFKYFGFWATVNSPKDLQALERQAVLLRETRGV